MSNNCWSQLDTPICALAPMEDVTDVAFREMFARYGKPDVMFTEFTSADGLLSGGWERLKHQLWYTQDQRPIIAQLFSDDPENMRRASRLCRNLGFDGIDINMCCPSKTVCNNGCGSALIKKPELAQELIAAAQDGAGDIPVSVKTRIGYEKKNIDSWIRTLLSTDLAAVSIHARTRAQMSNVPADWDAIQAAVNIRDQVGADTLIVGNGDVYNWSDAADMIEQTDCDGVMFARGAYGTPWLFKNIHNKRAAIINDKSVDADVPPIIAQLDIMIKHTRLFDRLLGDHINFRLMRKHFKAYAKGFSHAKHLRKRLMDTDNLQEVEVAVSEWCNTHQPSHKERYKKSDRAGKRPS